MMAALIVAHASRLTDALPAVVVAAAVSGLFGWVTQRSAARANLRSTETTTRTDIEKEAFERAKGFYTDTIDRQDRQITELEADVAREKSERVQEVGRVRSELADVRNQLERTKYELREAKIVIRRLSRQAEQ